MISVGKCAPRPLLLPKYPSNQAMGSMQTSVTTPTMPIGMSRAVIGSVSARPAFRARDAAIALARPLATGITSLRSVQIAETPIAPAPTKRTFVLQVFCACVAAAVVRSPAIAEKCGMPQPHPINAPISIAIPTDKPTKCPIPRRANDKKKSYPLTAPRLPIRKVCATSAANTCVWTTTANTAATIEPQSTASRPAFPCSMSEACLESLLLPTLSTSAHATPSGYGKSEVGTSARRRGIEYITPRIPPSAQIQNEIQNGNSVHQPIMIRPGSTKMICQSVPAGEQHGG